MKLSIVGLPLAALGCFLVGQTAVVSEPWEKILANGGSLSLLGWYLYYRTRHADPRLHQEHTAAIDRIITNNQQLIDRVVDRHEEHTREIVGSFQAELKIAREENAKNRDAWYRGKRDPPKSVG